MIHRKTGGADEESSQLIAKQSGTTKVRIISSDDGCGKSASSPLSINKATNKKNEITMIDNTKNKGHATSFCNSKVLFSCSLFMTAGPLLIMTNKSIITELEFRYPVIVTSFGIISSSIIVHLFHRLGYIQIRNEIKKLVTIKFLISHIFIISFLQSLTMFFGNKAYIFLSVSLIQMLKAFTPVITMCFLFISGQSTPTYQLIIAILLLSFGTAITSTGVSSNDANITGFLLAAGAQFTEALKLTLQQKLLQGFKIKLIASQNSIDTNDKNINILRNIGNGDQVEYEKKIKFTTFEGLYYYAPMTFISICIIVVPLEMTEFIANWEFNKAIISKYCYVFLLAGGLGFLVNVASFMVTKVTSGLYLKALNAFRNVCLVIACVIIFGDIVTTQQALGYVVTLIGFGYYNYIKLYGNKK